MYVNFPRAERTRLCGFTLKNWRWLHCLTPALKYDLVPETRRFVFLARAAQKQVVAVAANAARAISHLLNSLKSTDGS